MDVVRIREFLLASYHDLPNILFVGSLLIGVLTGYLPLIWMALGLLLNAASVGLIQVLLVLLFPSWDQVVQPYNSPACMSGFQRANPIVLKSGAANRRIAPSFWMSSATFFSVFSIYNSLRVAVKESAPGTDPEKVATRRAFSLSALVIGVAFFFLVLLRAFTGCESILGGVLGVLVGSGLGIGFWHLLDLCGTGRIPDILQVVGSMAPEANQPEVPVVCSPPKEDL